MEFGGSWADTFLPIASPKNEGALGVGDSLGEPVMPGTCKRCLGTRVEKSCPSVGSDDRSGRRMEPNGVQSLWCDSWLCLQPAVRSWPGLAASRSLGFLIHEMRTFPAGSPVQCLGATHQ